MTRNPLLLLLLVLAVPAGATHHKPLVQPVFKFAPSVCSRINGPARIALEGRLSGVLLTVLREKFPFVEWSTVVPRGRKSHGQFIVRLVPRRFHGVAHYLTYRRTVTAENDRKVNSEWMRAINPVDPLYAGDEAAHPCTDGTKLDDRLRKALDNDLDVFRDEIAELFFAYIPVSTVPLEVDTDSAGKLIVPVPWAMLEAGRDTHVRLVVGKQREIRAEVHRMGRHERDNGTSVACGAVAHFESVDVPPTSAWSSKIPGVLARDAGKPAMIVVTKYRRNADAPNWPPSHPRKRRLERRPDGS